MSENIDEYLETLYRLKEKGEAAKTTSIAEELKVKPASATEMMQKLAARGYVKYEPYKGVRLTRKGLSKAKKITRKHRLFERFLTKILGVERGKAHDEACKLEHSMSDDVEKRMDVLLGHPKKCPNGNPIPGERKHKEILIPLTNLNPGENARIVELSGGRGLVAKLRAMGVREGKIVKVLTRYPGRGPIVVNVGGVQTAIGRGMAWRILVRVKM